MHGQGDLTHLTTVQGGRHANTTSTFISPSRSGPPDLIATQPAASARSRSQGSGSGGRLRVVDMHTSYLHNASTHMHGLRQPSRTASCSTSGRAACAAALAPGITVRRFAAPRAGAAAPAPTRPMGTGRRQCLVSGDGRRLLVAFSPFAVTPRPPPRLRAAATSDRQGGGSGGGGSGRSSRSSPDLGAAFDAFVRDASPKVEAAVDDLKRSASRAASRLDSEYDLSGRASKAKRRLKEQATDVDQQWGIRRKLRVWSEDLKKAWPVWSRRFEEYASTPVGRFSVIAGVVLLMTTTVFWKVCARGLLSLPWGCLGALHMRLHFTCMAMHKHAPVHAGMSSMRACTTCLARAPRHGCWVLLLQVLHGCLSQIETSLADMVVAQVVNWLLFLWWLAIPIATFAIQRQASEQMKRAKEAAAEQEERRRDPLGSMFRRATGARRTSGNDSTASSDSGPVIDAEWRDVSDKK
eukprot:363423-Chlamydomonas_euryale.AAC.4